MHPLYSSDLALRLSFISVFAKLNEINFISKETKIIYLDFLPKNPRSSTPNNSWNNSFIHKTAENY